jgi:dTMP kinase
MLVAIEGIDGCGKATQAAFLEERAAGLPHVRQTRLLTYPRYDKFFGRQVRAYLDGEYGSLHANDPYLVSLLYSLDRVQQWQDPLLHIMAKSPSAVIVSDRYVAANAAHQGAKVADPQVRGDLIYRMQMTEYELGMRLPRPHVTVLLRLPVEVARARAAARRKLDLHEVDAGYLAAVAEVYDVLALDPSWVVVDADASPKVVSEGVWAAVAPVLTAGAACPEVASASPRSGVAV